MSGLTADQIYQKEYDAARAELDAAADGQTVATPAPTKEPGKVAEVEIATPEVTEEKPVDPLEELRTRLEKAEKVAQDNKAWGTRQAQELAVLKRERDQQQREAIRPAILDANPDLADAIRYVASDPAPRNQEAEQQQNWQSIVEKAHPGIFSTDIDPELETALVTRLGALGEQRSDPLLVIREITAEKVAHAERQMGKRFAVESAKLAAKSAMTVPGSGSGGARTTTDPDAEAIQRIQKMSDADFRKEVARVKGY